ncbi:hypothetical protein N658DRAFT_300509 [Parathielavia hyrcaniae]|uniref:Uncharacterized protein n=1 Tax=Parathielavia hyrcaniae TaxID=113614 RepID=A0AAN6Q7B0_9PEZI|nr:hypothetical protein N658DRAFT_300509 [Parathielavia hyrcaniae]
MNHQDCNLDRSQVSDFLPNGTFLPIRSLERRFGIPTCSLQDGFARDLRKSSYSFPISGAADADVVSGIRVNDPKDNPVFRLSDSYLRSCSQEQPPSPLCLVARLCNVWIWKRLMGVARVGVSNPEVCHSTDVPKKNGISLCRAGRKCICCWSDGAATKPRSALLGGKLQLLNVQRAAQVQQYGVCETHLADAV